MDRKNNIQNANGFTVWQLLLAVTAMSSVLSITLGSLSMPAPQDPYAGVYHPPFDSYNEFIDIDDELHEEDCGCELGPELEQPEPTESAEPIVELVPFNINGEIPGPLLAEILQRYMPESTDEEATDLRNTLPPGADPRMIVILPDGSDKPL